MPTMNHEITLSAFLKIRAEGSMKKHESLVTLFQSVFFLIFE
jgi:hypothetical protein